MESSPEVKEIRVLQKELDALSEDDKISDPARAQKLLEKLNKINVTLDVLRVTKVGKTVSKVRRAAKDIDGVEKAAKALIAQWKVVAGQDGDKPPSQEKGRDGEREKDRDRKERLPEPPAKKARPSPTATPSPVPAASKPALARTTSQSSHTSTSSSKPAIPARRSSGVEVEFRMTGDTMRDNCRRMLAQALNGDGTDLMGAIPGRIAEKIEEAIFRDCQGPNQKYKTAVLSRRSNLADPKNDLRNQVLIGAVTPERLATMTPKEMASKDVLKQIEEAHKANLHEAQVGGGTTTMTDMFKCGKCKKNNCSYFQMQTRSADEPMTTFVTCNVCGNKWKFC